MQQALIYFIVASTGGIIGFAAAILMLGAQAADRYEQEFLRNANRQTDNRGRRNEANTNSRDNELM